MDAYYLIILSVFALLLSSFFLAQSYVLIFWYKKYFGYSQLFKELSTQLNGTMIKSGYYAQSHHVITPQAFKNLRNSEKVKFSQCYNIIKFKTKSSRWEIFLYLVKEGFTYNEIIIIRCFPNHKILSNEANIERVRGHISIFSSNRYLAEVLQQQQVTSAFEWLIRYDTDSFLIQHNNLMFKGFCQPKLMRSDQILKFLKVVESIKKEVYDKSTIKY
ncbi:MAG: hypothetical protein ACLFPL_03910 [Candidatus Nanoarchaeia archaeon]